MINRTGTAGVIYKPDYPTAMKKAKAVLEEVEAVGRDVAYLDNNSFYPEPDEYVTINGKIFRPDHMLDADGNEGSVWFGTGKGETLRLNGRECTGAEGAVRFDKDSREISSMNVRATVADEDKKSTKRMWDKQVSDSIERYTIKDSLSNEESVVELDTKTGILRYSFSDINTEN
ncbi:MAG: hypothetical protein AB2L14_03325 [Candidatus Xenobiia bacterium LiM19]